MILRIKKAIKKLINYNKKKIISKNDLLQYNRVKPWFEAKGDQTLRLDYDLSSESIVFDVGGYKGEFATEMFCKYCANIYIFEPIKDFNIIIKNKFLKNEKVKIFNFGLAGKDQELEICLSYNSSSIYLNGGDRETVRLKSIIDFIITNDFKQIDLIKINIEGGEYELLETLIDNGYICMFKNIQVQFHDFLFENARERMNRIQENLSHTHEITYQYEFVWENWKIKNDSN